MQSTCNCINIATSIKYEYGNEDFICTVLILSL